MMDREGEHGLCWKYLLQCEHSCKPKGRLSSSYRSDQARILEVRWARTRGER